MTKPYESAKIVKHCFKKANWRQKVSGKRLAEKLAEVLADELADELAKVFSKKLAVSN